MSRTKLPCGCVHNALGWLCSCVPHEAENAAHHAQAGIEHAAAMRARDPEYVSTPKCPNQEALS